MKPAATSSPLLPSGLNKESEVLARPPKLESGVRQFVPSKDLSQLAGNDAFCSVL
ncbi:hypothetical protein SAMN02745166_02517 [Prosthecobacter debontii]|uniref:Uncharacterized protein n=1 Tax=Prosthecobacter debontii TaxID=48467 RepID=A0A1T4Y5C4_9BACT|nr:hypothetical protein SAMN02745166_02517 [Prosthecobacter debontii]